MLAGGGGSSRFSAAGFLMCFGGYKRVASVKENEFSVDGNEANWCAYGVVLMELYGALITVKTIKLVL